MEYIAHKDKNDGRTQTIKEHLYGTAELAREFADRFGKADWGYYCGMLHDIGKYSREFQEKIETDSNKRVDHSTAGAKVCFEKGGLYSFMSYCIAGHHSGLPNYGSSSDTDSTLQSRKRKEIPDYSAYEEEIRVPEISTQPFDVEGTPDLSFSMSVFIRMIYSCLVDADFLDTEKFMKKGQTLRDAGDSTELLLEKLKDHVSEWMLNKNSESVNGRRTEILSHCLEHGKNGRGIFKLTVPTGGGKTISSLAFALRHAVENNMDRVIYVIPYTSIIEQNAEIFRGILGDNNVLEDHYNVDYNDLGDPEKAKPIQLASENWDKPVVVTTNVRFFESLYANKPSRCRKIHNIANSVIIFDEVQMLPRGYLRPCIAMMEELVSNFRSSIVLCTATQPVLTSFFHGKPQINELCPRVEEQFRFFERVTFKTKGIVSEEELIENLKKEDRALCIVNTKKRAQRLYQEMRSEGVFHLSTAMYPKHRRKVLEKIRTLLDEEKKCVLISTSLVETGVDLNFRAVYRQLAGVDSIIQAAGRCNREGKQDAQNSFVYIFKFYDEDKVDYGQQRQIDVSEMVISEIGDFPSQKVIEEYFKSLYHFEGELDKKKILKKFKDKKYEFASAADEFKLIEENTQTVFVGREKDAADLLQKMKAHGCTKAMMRDAGQYCINLYESDIKKLREAGMLEPISEDIKDFFEIVDVEQYTDEMGLDFTVESGAVVFM